MTGSKYGDNKLTITLLLHRDNPRFLYLDKQWVDDLLEAEWDSKDKNGNSSLVYLFGSNQLNDFDFGCRRFKILM